MGSDKKSKTKKVEFHERKIASTVVTFSVDEKHVYS